MSAWRRDTTRVHRRPPTFASDWIESTSRRTRQNGSSGIRRVEVDDFFSGRFAGSLRRRLRSSRPTHGGACGCDRAVAFLVRDASAGKIRQAPLYPLRSCSLQPAEPRTSERRRRFRSLLCPFSAGSLQDRRHRHTSSTSMPSLRRLSGRSVTSQAANIVSHGCHSWRTTRRLLISVVDRVSWPPASR